MPQFTTSAALDSKAIRTNAAKNPEQLVSTQQSALEQSRQLVKSAQLQFEVHDVLKTTSTLEQQLLQYNGYIEEAGQLSGQWQFPA